MLGRIRWKLLDSGGKRTKNKKKPILFEKWAQVTANDSHIYADDLTIKTTQVNEIYPKLETFETSSKKIPNKHKVE